MIHFNNFSKVSVWISFFLFVTIIDFFKAVFIIFISQIKQSIICCFAFARQTFGNSLSSSLRLLHLWLFCLVKFFSNIDKLLFRFFQLLLSFLFSKFEFFLLRRNKLVKIFQWVQIDWNFLLRFLLRSLVLWHHCYWLVFFLFFLSLRNRYWICLINWDNLLRRITLSSSLLESLCYATQTFSCFFPASIIGSLLVICS